MHNSVKFAASAAAVLMLCSCNKGVSVSLAEKSYQATNAEAILNVPEFSFEQAAEFADSVNDELENAVMACLDDFISRAEKEEKEATLTVDSKIIRNDSRIVSVMCEGFAEDGSAHGERFRITKTFDFGVQKNVTLEELFEGDEWKRIIDTKLKELCTDPNGDYAQLWEQPTVAMLNPDNFYIKEGKLIIYYPPYELSYYRRGFVEFEFSKEQIVGYLSDYGREIL